MGSSHSKGKECKINILKDLFYVGYFTNFILDPPSQKTVRDCTLDLHQQTESDSHRL